MPLLTIFLTGQPRACIVTPTSWILSILASNKPRAGLILAVRRSDRTRIEYVELSVTRVLPGSSEGEGGALLHGILSEVQ
jgi:hypothetical protein